MFVTLLTSFQELYDIESDWNALARGVPFRTREWLHGWWRHYGRQRQLFTPVVFDYEGQLIGVVPLYLERSASHGRVLRPLGSGEVCSDYLSVLCAPEHETLVTDAVADLLCDEPSLKWDLFHWNGVDEDDSAVKKLTDALAARGNVVHSRPAHRCWRMELPGDWESYLAQHSKSHRKQLRRFESRVLSTSRAELHCVQSSEELEKAWKILVDLHQRRRQSLGEPGSFASEQFRGFHHEACYWLLASKQLRLYWLDLDGEPIAAEYQLAGRGLTYCYQAGVDPERMAEDPGQLITMATIQKAIEEGQQGLDFLRGDEPYKAHWRAVPRQTHDYRIVSRRTAAKLRHNLWIAADNMKHWVKGGMALMQGET